MTALCPRCKALPHNRSGNEVDSKSSPIETVDTSKELQDMLKAHVTVRKLSKKTDNSRVSAVMVSLKLTFSPIFLQTYPKLILFLKLEGMLQILKKRQF